MAAGEIIASLLAQYIWSFLGATAGVIAFPEKYPRLIPLSLVIYMALGKAFGPMVEKHVPIFTGFTGASELVAAALGIIVIRKLGAGLTKVDFSAILPSSFVKKD
jgi:hypothetical protein